MKFALLAEYLQELERTASRNAMTEQLSQVFEEAGVDEIEAVVNLVLGRLAPLYRRVEFNVADKMVMRAIVKSVGVPIEEVVKEYKKRGDLGLVVQEIMTATESSLLTTGEVFEGLMGIAIDGGQGSQERKVGGLADLLAGLSGMEAKYVVRMVLGKLRLGFSDKTILDAISVMVMGSKGGRERLEMAYQVFPDVGKLAEMVKERGILGIEERVQVTLGIPVMPALCQRLKSAEEMLAKMGEVMVEPKYDGTRVQIHYASAGVSGVIDTEAQGTVFLKTFTRNLDETTWMFPELLEGVRQVKATSVILDTEAVGVHPKTGVLLPFQETITRKRKHGIEEASRQVPLLFFVFDMLYFNGESLLHLPLRERKRLLSQVMVEGSVLRLSPTIETKEAGVLREFHAEQLRKGLEGAVVKQVDGDYIPGRRGWNWVKFKEAEDTEGKLADTVDLVVMGWYRGKGKRARFGIGAFLVGVRSGEMIVTVAKIGTGLSDEQWQELRRRLEEQISLEKPVTYQVHTQLVPDIWVDPVVVVEVAADEITRSPTHTAGIALRFPRLIRFREDKGVGEVTTRQELEELKELSG